MSDKVEASIQAHFGNIDDPRRSYLNEHPLINIITIALCAVIAGPKDGQTSRCLGSRNKRG